MNGLDPITKFMTKILVERSELAPEIIKFDAPIENIGIASADAVFMCGMMEEEFDVDIDPALIFECATLQEFAEEILKLVKPAQ